MADRLVIGRLTLQVWLLRYGTAVYQQKKRKVFVSTHKPHIVRELRDGRLTEDEALLKYGLRLKSML